MKVDPKKLIMTGIEAGPDETIEESYQLRWFTGPDLKFPATAFPDEETVNNFVNAESPGDLEFNQKQIPAFHIFRRRHHFHLDHNIRLSTRDIRFLMAGWVPSIIRYGIKITAKRSLTLFKSESNQSGSLLNKLQTFFVSTLLLLLNFVSKVFPFISSWLSQWTTVEIMVSFPKTVHCLEVESHVQGIWSFHYLQMNCYANDDPEPIRTELFNWTKVTFWERFAKVTIDQGHYDLLRIRFNQFFPIDIRFSYMVEDVTMAQDPENPSNREWVNIAYVPFITSFRNWELARDHHFQHIIKNRYLDFQYPSLSLSPEEEIRQKLDLKYGDVFKKLQQIFLLLKYTENLNNESFIEELNESLTGLEFKPYTILQILSIDPIIATLLGLKYADAPGGHNPNPPNLRETYDYMVATAWQNEDERICYISQKVSHKTTPRLLPPSELIGAQEEGLRWEGDTSLYHAGLNWTISERKHAEYKYYEPVAFDIWRGDQVDSGNWVTLYYDESAEQNRYRVVDKPVVVPESFRYPVEQEERSRYSHTQLAALDLDRALREQNSSFLITADNVSAYETMNSQGRIRFLATEKTTTKKSPPKFNEWLSITDTQRSVFYKARGIDIFGRVSDESNPVKATLTRKYPPPEVIGLRAYLIENNAVNNTKDLMVTWRLGPYQEGTGEKINHFNVVHKEMKTKDKVRSFDWDNPDSGLEWRKFGNEWTPILDIEPISYDEPIDLHIKGVTEDWNEFSISGTIENISMSTSQMVVTEGEAGSQTIKISDYESKLISGFPLTIKTDQCFWGISPFVDINDRYRQQDNSISVELDNLKLRIGNDLYDVIAFEGGQSLRLVINFNQDCERESACDAFKSLYGINPSFTLQFTNVKTVIEWNQRITLNDLKESDVGLKEKFERMDISK